MILMGIKNSPVTSAVWQGLMLIWLLDVASDPSTVLRSVQFDGIISIWILYVEPKGTRIIPGNVWLKALENLNLFAGHLIFYKLSCDQGCKRNGPLSERNAIFFKEWHPVKHKNK